MPAASASERPKRQRGETEEEDVDEKEEEKPLDFSQWAWQDVTKAPLPSFGSSCVSAMRWLGVQSLASLAGKSGQVFVNDALCKRGLTFEKGFVEGRSQKTHVVMPLDAPGLVVDLFSESALAKKVLQTASFAQRLEEAGADPNLLHARISEALAELEVFTPEEKESLLTLCKLRGKEEGKAFPLRGARVDGELVIAMIDFVMVVKKCGYQTAKTICRRLLREYWNFDVEEGSSHEGSSVTPHGFNSVRFRTGDLGGQETLCASASVLAEVLIMIPGCELSTELRRDMVQSFYGVGDNRVTFASLLSNPRIRDHLRGCTENPVVEILEDREHKELMRSFPRLLQTLQQKQEELQLALDKKNDELQLALETALGRREDRILTFLAQKCEQLPLGVVFAMQRSTTVALQPLLQSLQPLNDLLVLMRGLSTSVSMSVRGAVKDVIDAAVTSADSKLVKALRAATKAPAKRSSADGARFPASQRATPKQKLEALSLAKVAYEEFPRRDLHYNTWKCVRSEYGKRCKAERLRRHALAVASPDFEPQPLLWCTGILDGCKERYLYLERHSSMLREVWHRKPPFGRSLNDWAVELQATAKTEVGYVEVEWPEDAAEHEVFE